MNYIVRYQGVNEPEYATDGASGADIRAHLPNGSVTIKPGKRAKIGTGLKVEIPERCEGQIRSRSGMGDKYGVSVLLGVGTIDSDYRGEISVVLVNHGDTDFVVTDEMRIAQLVIAPVFRVKFSRIQEGLTATDRGTGGFGSTGTH